MSFFKRLLNLIFIFRFLIFGLTITLFFTGSALAFFSDDSIIVPTELSGLDLVSGQKVEMKLRDSRLATVLVFLSIKCPCSHSHISTLKELAKEFGPLGVQFVGIHSNSDEDISASREYFRSTALPFPVVQDQDDEVFQYAKKLRAKKTPHVYLIGSQSSSLSGLLFQGGIDNSKIAQDAKKYYLKEALQAVVRGQKPDPSEVRVLGCEIKVKRD